MMGKDQGMMDNSSESEPNETENQSEEPQDSTPDSAELPGTLFGDKPPQAGDKVTFEVKSVDGESGAVTVTMPAAPAKKQLGVKAMASAFD